ncbi:cytochrome P450 family protein [Jiangella alkaliphila]|uniref:Cytochrome P450 n=1 Tax=Jiangella alkaliphila TaxID=419479 RepID=A0A1H2L718_9ACTN|nr:cytochrome P450 [Jiangella alkaliphila]SDU76602.1 hypothetical protein SAMN04488563_5255 [Jiangella alkaliphila]
MNGVLVTVVALVAVASLPYWLPHLVVALRMWVFARINGPDGIQVPGELIDESRFLEIYSHPAVNGRSHGAGLSDLFWYWLSPGAEVHQEHLEPGPVYDEVAHCTRRILTMPTAEADRLAVQSLHATLHTTLGAPARSQVVRLRDLVMPVWAEFYHRVVFQRPCTDDVRALIVGNADDVITALKCTGLRHLDRRLRLTAHLERVLDDVPHELPSSLQPREQAFYLQGTFFNTAVVQSSEATAHLLMALAADDALQRAASDEALLDHAFEQTLRRYPLFGVAHRITTADVELSSDRTLPAGSVLCFDYPEFHRSGGYIPFGVAANRPCPAWHLAPVTVKAVTRELLRDHTLATTAAHTRALPNRGPCLMAPRGTSVPLRAPRLALMRVRDRWEDVSRSIVQLVLGTYMVWDARRLRLCQRYFEGIRT